MGFEGLKKYAIFYILRVTPSIHTHIYMGVSFFGGYETGGRPCTPETGYETGYETGFVFQGLKPPMKPQRLKKNTMKPWPVKPSACRTEVSVNSPDLYNLNGQTQHHKKPLQKASEGTSKQNKNPATPEIAGQNRVKYEIGYETGYETGMKPFGHPRLENSVKVWARVLARSSSNNNNGSRGSHSKSNNSRQYK